MTWLDRHRHWAESPFPQEPGRSRFDRDAVTLSRSQLIGIGVLAVIGTGVFAVVDQSHERAASTTAERARQEKSEVGPSVAAVDQFRAPVARPERTSGDETPGAAPSTPLPRPRPLTTGPRS